MHVSLKIKRRIYNHIIIKQKTSKSIIKNNNSERKKYIIWESFFFLFSLRFLSLLYLYMFLFIILSSSFFFFSSSFCVIISSSFLLLFLSFKPLLLARYCRWLLLFSVWTRRYHMHVYKTYIIGRYWEMLDLEHHSIAIMWYFLSLKHSTNKHVCVVANQINLKQVHI